jgi:ribonuclease P protein component
VKAGSFPKSVRLRTSFDFYNFYGNSRSIIFRSCKVYFANSPVESGRLGLSISKKELNSPQRNKVKRMCREWYRLNKPLFSNVDLCFHVNRQYFQRHHAETSFVEFLIIFKNDLLNLNTTRMLNGK